MGHCFSIQHSDAVDPTEFGLLTARVISINGDLREYALPATAAEVLDSEMFSSSSGCILCNSDHLCYNDYIPALSHSEALYPGQIYFVLPISKLQNRLSASDMAALAVKASLALRNSDEGRRSGGRFRRRRKSSKTQISPILFVNNSNSCNDYQYQTSSIEDGGSAYDPSKTVRSFGSKPMSIDRSRSARKMQRLSSRRMKLAVRSFRMKLSTIYEVKTAINQHFPLITSPTEAITSLECMDPDHNPCSCHITRPWGYRVTKSIV
ncbi:hypothetical protein SAY87_002909 [Trapa incisa]|uniref:Uncharacterized protein n=1 Tax=Trapa incisa TaxID=236973 RepID=A0AAN7KN79_9MYRT|nr:hypothetical protein SAY87_002909 [Trapa incisa]